MAAVVGRFGAGLLPADLPQTGRRQPLSGHLSPGDVSAEAGLTCQVGVETEREDTGW